MRLSEETKEVLHGLKALVGGVIFFTLLICFIAFIAGTIVKIVCFFVQPIWDLIP